MNKKDLTFGIILILSMLILGGLIGWNIYNAAKEFNDSHKEKVTSVVVTIDD